MTPQGVSRIASLITAERGGDFNADRLSLWAVALQDVTDEQGWMATIRVLQDSPYPPTIAAIRRVIFGDPQDAERRLDEEAELAIAHLERHICDYRICDFGSVLNAVMRAMGGVDAIVATMTSGTWKFERNRAKTLYRAFVRRPPAGSEGEPVTPMAVSENLSAIPSEVYLERGLPMPIARAPFSPPPAPMLPSSWDGR